MPNWCQTHSGGAGSVSAASDEPRGDGREATAGETTAGETTAGETIAAKRLPPTLRDGRKLLVAREVQKMVDDLEVIVEERGEHLGDL